MASRSSVHKRVALLRRTQWPYCATTTPQPPPPQCPYCATSRSDRIIARLIALFSHAQRSTKKIILVKKPPYRTYFFNHQCFKNHLTAAQFQWRHWWWCSICDVGGGSGNSPTSCLSRCPFTYQGFNSHFFCFPILWPSPASSRRIGRY